MAAIRNLSAAVAASLVMALGATAAHAGQRLTIVVDASGSMIRDREDPDDPMVEITRFALAKRLAQDAINDLESNISKLGPIQGISVYVFQGSGFTSLAPGGAHTYMNSDDATLALAGFNSPANLTPLAFSLCGVVDSLFATNGAVNPADTNTFFIATDGGENNSPVFDALTAPCGNQDAVDPNFEANSWQRRALDRIGLRGWSVDATLLTGALITGPVAPFAPFSRARVLDVDSARSFTMKKSARLAVSAVPVTDELFFARLAQETGGTFRLIRDDDHVPLDGDSDDDGCISLGDANDVLRAFGDPVPAGGSPFDVNNDGEIGFGDFFITLGNINPACSAPDPFVTVQPFQCRGNQPIVLDGKAITSFQDAVTVRGSCTLIVRNSRLVSGGAALRVSGAAQVIVENSTIVGDRALIVLNGSAVIMAKGSYFSGARELKGAFAFIDLGGNTWKNP